MSINDVNRNLKSYVETHILPLYKNNDEGHQLAHILNVIDRSFEITKDINELNADIIYAAASFHDIGTYHTHEAVCVTTARTYPGLCIISAR